MNDRGRRGFTVFGARPDPAAAGRGQSIFVENCAGCHGQTANGGQGPNLVRSELVLHDDAGSLIVPYLKTGRPDQGMPAFAKMSDSQLADISVYLHARVEGMLGGSRNDERIVPPADASAGEGAFQRLGCPRCHSLSGDLAHIGAKLDFAQLRGRIFNPAASGRGGRGGRGAAAEGDSPAENDAAGSRKVTVILPSGASISGTLKLMDDFDVALIDDSGEYHSWPRAPGLKITLPPDRLETHKALAQKYTDQELRDIAAYLETLK